MIVYQNSFTKKLDRNFLKNTNVMNYILIIVSLLKVIISITGAVKFIFTSVSVSFPVFSEFLDAVNRVVQQTKYFDVIMNLLFIISLLFIPYPFMTVLRIILISFVASLIFAIIFKSVFFLFILMLLLLLLSIILIISHFYVIYLFLIFLVSDDLNVNKSEKELNTNSTEEIEIKDTTEAITTKKTNDVKVENDELKAFF